MGPPRWGGATGQRDQLRLLLPVELPIEPARGFLAEQRRRHAFLHKGLADPIHRRCAAFDGFHHPVIVPTRSPGPHIGFQQNPRMDQRGRRPVLPRVDQMLQVGAFFIG